MTSNTPNHKNNSKKNAQACPKPGSSAHIRAKVQKPVLSPRQVRSALSSIDVGPGSHLMRMARYFAFPAEMDPDDLLQDALVRSLSTRACPAGLGIKPFINGVMRSIASDAVERRERGTAILRTGMIAGLTCQSLGPVSPDEILDEGKRAAAYDEALASITAGDPTHERVIDGIGLGLRGTELMAFADVSELKLAAVRRTLKRRSVPEYEALQRFDDAA